MGKYEEILEYWFGNTDISKAPTDDKRKLWFTKSDTTDHDITKRFMYELEKVTEPEYESWSDKPDSCLALIILIDQFSRNIYRNDEKSFRFDYLGQKLALKAIENNFDKMAHPTKRLFFYLPLEHSEDLNLQKKCMELFEQLVLEPYESIKKELVNFAEYAKKHYEIIEKFGRFPHRNNILNRESTPEEKNFLSKPGSSF